MYRVIIEHHPKANQEQKVIDIWKKGSDIIQTYKGARGTKLFRNLDNPEVLFAIAEWESKEDRDRAMNEIEKRDDAELILRGEEQFEDELKLVAKLELISESNPPTP